MLLLKSFHDHQPFFSPSPINNFLKKKIFLYPAGSIEFVCGSNDMKVCMYVHPIRYIYLYLFPSIYLSNSTCILRSLIYNIEHFVKFKVTTIMPIRKGSANAPHFKGGTAAKVPIVSLSIYPSFGGILWCRWCSGENTALWLRIFEQTNSFVFSLQGYYKATSSVISLGCNEGDVERALIQVE